MLRILAGLFLALAAASAHALGASDAGIFVALNQDGQPIEKILRVTRTPTDWKFEDRQPDGSWLDVSCHGGCQHRNSTVRDLVRFFGTAPPPGLKPDCVQNEQYGFCHFVKTTPDQEKEGYVLVVRIKDRWLPVSLVRLPGSPESPDAPDAPAPPPLESASLM